MRLQEITSIVRDYFFLAAISVIVLGILFFLGYFVFYRKFFGGKKRLPKKQLLFGGLFAGYVIMVIGVTFLNRGSNFQGSMNLSFLSSYREAWYSFRVRNWQFLLLNIFMFVPFGILLPLLHSRFQKAIWTFGAALLFTLSIESFQLITGFGIFELDDLFHNLLGAIIGYGILKGLIRIKEKEVKKAIICFSPLLLVAISFGGILTFYHLKEFGNLSIVPIHKTEMSKATVTMDVKLNDNKMTVPVYKAPSYTKTAADAFVKDFSKRLHLDTSNMEVISYQDEGVYWFGRERSHNIWFKYLDGSYRYTDFSSFDEDKELKDADESTLKEELTKFGIDLPQDTYFQKVETGTFKWTVNKRVVANQLIDGSLSVNYYSDGTVKRIDNQFVTYDKVRDVEIKSEQEAYKEILEGKFKYFSENKRIKTLHIHKIEVSYYLDSKGFYQPVYALQSTVDGEDMTLFIPGI
ncbi:VanZ family protein [Neobacillus niacini]|uniref:VanZ family protein n=1 Tax=Neobacillus niacini TaxID=86668 RepID=UPI0021CB7F31|nr:VanZ family protein [Neobacillus niacini]MCM3764934.1 VanZ family protein [Neobacillus niacini]